MISSVRRRYCSDLRRSCSSVSVIAKCDRDGKLTKCGLGESTINQPRFASPVVMHRPPHVLAARLRQHIRRVARVHGDVMFKAVVADEMEQFLEPRDLRDGTVAE